MIGGTPVAVAPGVDQRPLELTDADLAVDTMVLVGSEWRTDPTVHLYVTSAATAAVTKCAICGAPVKLKLLLDGEKAPVTEAYLHADETLHLVPSDHLISKRLSEMGL